MRATSIENKVVVITGASSGIGAATALACGRKGMRVVLIARRTAELEKVADQVKRAGGEALPLSLDVTAAGALESGISQVIQAYGRIDVLLTCAGRSFHHSVELSPDQEIEKLVEVNYLSTVNAIRAALPAMRHQRSGHIMLVGSVAAEVMFPNDAIYTSTKAAIHRLAHGLRNELHGTGIDVSLIIPGIVETELTAGLSGISKADPSVVAKDILACIAKPRFKVVTPKHYSMVLTVARIAPASVARYVAKRIGRS